ncbi:MULTISPECIES: hypothetical protein [unclassified Duganella]|uniref:hypothetical protein n=1 Tax=unclassified Duganella TaxID=2636909 RepID=UPI0011C14858|nr:MULTISPECIES: hypothetical protein [unclassified Duganella]
MSNASMRTRGAKPSVSKRAPVQGLLGKLKTAVMAKPLNISRGLPGSSVTIEHPGRSSPPPRPAAPEPAAADPVMAECERVAGEAHAILQHALEPTHSLFERPGRRSAMSKLASHLPWLKAKPIMKLATLDQRPLKAAPVKPAVAGAPGEIQAHLVSDLAQRSEKHRQAMEEYQAVETDHLQAGSTLEAAGHDLARINEQIIALTARAAEFHQALETAASALANSGGSFSPERLAHLKRHRQVQQLTLGNQQALRDAVDSKALIEGRMEGLADTAALTAGPLAAARSKVMEAAAHLHSAVHVSQLHDVAGAVLSADIARQHLDFVHDELRHLRGMIDGHLSDADNDASAAQRLLQQHGATRADAIDAMQTARANLAVQQDHVARLTHDLLQVDSALASGQARAATLSEQLDSGTDQPDRVAARLDQINDALPGLLAFKDDTGTGLEDAQARVRDAEAQIEHLLDQVDAIDVVMESLTAALSSAEERRGAATRVIQTLLEPMAETHCELREAESRHAQTLDSFNGLQAEFVDKLLLHPPGFDPSPATASLARSLRQMIDTWPDNPNADALPKLAVAELVTQALADVTGGDAARALQLLDRVRTAPTLAFISRHSGKASSSTAPPPVTADVRALFRHMAPLPRGAELLQMMGRNDHGLLDGKGLAALRAYWQADQAIESEPVADVRTWLGAARDVAAERLHWRPDAAPGDDLDSHLAATFDQRKLGAYNAVRNGLTSNAPGSEYDQHNRRLLNMTQSWVARADHRFAETGIGGLSPLRGKTPFKTNNLKHGAALAESFGIATHRTLADRAVREASTQLAQLAQAMCGNPAPPASDAQAFNVAVKVLAQYVGQREVRHDSAQDLTKLDFQAIKKLYLKEIPGAADLPPDLKALAADAAATGMTSASLPWNNSRHGLSATEVLRTVAQEFAERNAERLKPDQHAALAGMLGLDQAGEHFERAEVRRFESGEDVLKYFEPMLAEWGLRDKIKLSAGGALGAGLPFLPYAPPKIDALISAGLGAVRKDEAFVQFFQPILGIEMMVGESKTVSADATASVGKVWTVGGQKTSGAGKGGNFKVGLSGALKFSKSKMTMEGSIVRFLRPRHQDAAQRKNMHTALESVVLWDKLAPENSDAKFAGPVEALLSRCPEAVLTKLNAGADSHFVEARLSAAARYRKPTSANTRQGIGMTLGVAAKAELGLERRSEAAAGVNVTSDKTSTARQTVSLSAELLSPLPENASSYSITADRSPRGTLSGGSVPVMLTAIHQALQHMDKHGLSPFRIGNKQDSDIDRHYFTPHEMLAEIESNRGQWLARCMQTLPAVDGNVDTPGNREEAVRLLDRFVADITHLGKTSNYCQYNINYSMRPQASTWIDALNHLGDVAGMRNDKAMARRTKEATDAILQHPSTWRPLMLIVREKGKQAQENGINYGLRAQRVSSVESQRTAAQFPPP